MPSTSNSNNPILPSVCFAVSTAGRRKKKKFRDLLSPSTFIWTSLYPEALSGCKIFISKKVMSHVNHHPTATKEMVIYILYLMPAYANCVNSRTRITTFFLVRQLSSQRAMIIQKIMELAQKHTQTFFPGEFLFNHTPLRGQS